MHTLLKKYFSTTWLQRDRTLDQYEHSGWALLDKIGHERVLDVGCGTNPFKGKLDVYGIDITDVGADEVVAIEDFKPKEYFDVAFCLGSINFGTYSDIRNQIKCVDDALCSTSARIFWRCNPGQHDHGNDDFKGIQVFEWSEDLLRHFAALFGYDVVDFQQDGKRLYCEWKR